MTGEIRLNCLEQAWCNDLEANGEKMRLASQKHANMAQPRLQPTWLPSPGGLATGHRLFTRYKKARSTKVRGKISHQTFLAWCN